MPRFLIETSRSAVELDRLLLVTSIRFPEISLEHRYALGGDRDVDAWACRADSEQHLRRWAVANGLTLATVRRIEAEETPAGKPNDKESAMTTTTTVPASAPTHHLPGRAVLAVVLVGALIAAVALLLVRDDGSSVSPALTGAGNRTAVVGSADALERDALSTPASAAVSADALERQVTAAQIAATELCTAAGGSADAIERCIAREAGRGG